jgi:putative ABC transport system permease protein
MLRNYLLMAYAMLRRKKFLTFVNVFATSLTLTVLIVVAAAVGSSLFPRGAEQNSDHYLAIDNICLTGEGGRSWNSGPGYIFFTRYVAPLESPDKISFSSDTMAAVSYIDGNKLESQMRRTDGVYWEILDFEFLEGRPLTREDHDSGDFVAVINRKSRDTMLGDGDAVGQEITANGQTFTVVGVVENEPITNESAFADIWVPLTTAPSSGYKEQWLGGGLALLWSEDPANRAAIKREFRDSLDTFEYEDPEQLDTALAVAETRLEDFAGNFSDNWCSSTSSVGRFAGISILMVLAFMLLPAINMINLNVSRILERASEIGLRKAVGATKRSLISQFIIENLLLTAVGGLVAFLLAPWVLRVLNQTLVQYGRLTMDWRVFVAGLFFIALFAVFSGIYPAWKMARLEPVEALHGGTRNV